MRHRTIDKLYHWANALVILILIFTGFLPKLGVDFDWLNLHWIFGVSLILITVFHILTSTNRDKLQKIFCLKQNELSERKYTLPQKGIHFIFTVLILFIAGTGILIAFNADVIGVSRRSELYSLEQWGWIYWVHGIAGLFIMSFTMLHIYFNLRPENRDYLNSMLIKRENKL